MEPGQTDTKYEIYEPPAGSRMGRELEQFKKVNKLPLDKYKNPLSWKLNFEDVAERDGVGVVYVRGFLLTYWLTKETLNIEGDVDIESQSDEYLRFIAEKFEQLSDTPKYYFMYNYLNLVLRYREAKRTQ